VSKEIWLGPVLGNNRERLLERCAGYVTSGRTDRLLYIAASHPLLDLSTEKLLDGKLASGVWGDFPVYLFRGFVRRILSEANAAEPGAVATGLFSRPDPKTQRSAKPGRDTTRDPIDPVAIAPGSDGARPPSRTPIDREDFPLRRSLISQIIKQLAAAGKLSAIKPLANRDGCINTIASVIGELQRAGKSPQEFLDAVTARDAEAQSPRSKVPGPKSQFDFDREVALIYQTYSAALDLNCLTDEDADQLRALQALREGETEGLPWVDQIELLVLDGFFDFTPVQGEILRCLIPLIPNVIVNLNHDDANEEIFRPFQSTIDQLNSIAAFETVTHSDSAPPVSSLSPLRARLFNSAEDSASVGEGENGRQDVAEPQAGIPAIQSFECGDREVEIRSIAKEIKRLLFTEDYKLRDIALVVRERAAYADTIQRVMADESIPCNLERRIEAHHVPAVRACAKLFQILKEPDREQVANPKAIDLGHLIKTGYFRLSRETLAELAEKFDQKYHSLLIDDRHPGDERATEKLRARLGIGKWRPDDLENVIAYVGGELRANAWIDRARKLIDVFPSADDARKLIGGKESEDAAAVAEDEAPPEEAAVMERRNRPAPIHPAAIAWAVLLIRHLQKAIASIAEEGTPEDLRKSLMQLLDQLQFSRQVNRPFNQPAEINDLPQATLDVRGRESLRRAIAAARRSFEYAHAVVSAARPSEESAESVSPARGLLTHFIDEVERCLRSQVLAIGAANRDGLRVLEATDIRGLRFRAIFIAGMIEGGFPLRTTGDWLYPHEERLRLQKQGVFLEDISTDTLLKEEHYFYQAACRATERLYLTRPLTLSDGAETVASYYIEELKRAIAPVRIETKQFRADLDSRDISATSTSAELAKILIRQSEQPVKMDYQQAISQVELKDLIAGGHVSSSAWRRVEIERERNSQWYGPYDGEITNTDLRAMLARHFGAAHVYSASGLSTYGNCSFRFFGARVMRLEPRSEAALDLQSIDAGKLLHDILRRFFEQYRNQSLLQFDRDELREALMETADRVFEEHERIVPPLNDRIWKIDCEIRKLILDQVLIYELRLQELTYPNEVRPVFFELAFGRASQAADPSSKPDYLKFRRPLSAGNDFALIQGQIDRVDVGNGGVVAYDYKLSQGAKLKDLESGRALQIPIYLAALEQLFLPSSELAGGGYYILRARGPRLNQGLYRHALADHTNITNPKAKLDDIEWQRIRRETAKRIWEFIDSIRGGHFRVKPSLGRLTCKFCDYSAVCRFDAYRMGRKRAH
jgi:ATP-dependent helicase/DNAse subunit B